jgi:hypothetical protein
MFVRFFETEADESKWSLLHPGRNIAEAPKVTDLRKTRLFILFMSLPFKQQDYCRPSHLFK